MSLVIEPLDPEGGRPINRSRGFNIGVKLYWQIGTRRDLIADISKWCNENMGVEGEDWGSTRRGRIFFFKTEEQRLRFILTWKGV